MKIRMKSGAALAAVAGILAISLSACGGGAAKETSGATDQSGDATAAAEPAAGDLDICYITAAESHGYATPANEALMAAAKEQGVNVTMLSQDFDVQTGTEQMTTCIGRNPDGIVLWPLDPQAYLPGILAANNAGIPVVLINTPMGDEAEELIGSFTGPDVYQEGELAADAMNDFLTDGGKVVVIAGQAGNATSEGRVSGFEDRLKELNADIEILQVVNADFDQQKSLIASRDLITRFGEEIQGVYAGDDMMARGFIDAWKEAGLGVDKIPAIIGTNGQADAFESIESGEMYATIYQSPIEDGKLALETIVKLANGETVEKRLPIPLTVITSENVNDMEPAF